MKFIAQKTDRRSLGDGIHVHAFIEGREYEVTAAQFALLQKAGIAPSDEAEETKEAEPANEKAANPVVENKMAHPVTANKLKLNK